MGTGVGEVGLWRRSFPPWMSAASSVDFEGAANMSRSDASPSSPPHRRSSHSDSNMGFPARALSAAGAAFLSTVLMNPTRLQAQAAGVPNYPSQQQHGRQMASLGLNTILSDGRCFPSCACGGIFGSKPVCPPDCFQYKGTMDVIYKVVRQEGFTRLWRGTNAALALAVPTVGIYLPCYDIFRNWIEQFTTRSAPNLTPYGPLVAGSLARSLACIACSPIELARTRMQLRRRLLALVGEEGKASGILGANFWAGLVAGCLAAAATCPLDVAKTRRQIEDPSRALRMTTRQTLAEMWRDGGLKCLFAGVGPRVGRAGPSVGIVVSFYEVVKYVLHQRLIEA